MAVSISLKLGWNLQRSLPSEDLHFLCFSSRRIALLEQAPSVLNVIQMQRRQLSSQRGILKRNVSDRNSFFEAICICHITHALLYNPAVIICGNHRISVEASNNRKAVPALPVNNPCSMLISLS